MAIRRMGSYIDLTPAKESYEDTVKDIDSMISGFVLGIESMEAALTLSEVSTEDMSVRERKSYNLALEHIGRSVNIKPALEAEEDEDGETGVWAFIKRIWRKVCDTFASIWEKITNLFTDVDDRVKKADEKVEKKVEKLEEAIKTIDEPVKETKSDGDEPKHNTDPSYHNEKVNFIIKDDKITHKSVNEALTNLKNLNEFLRKGFPNTVKASAENLETIANTLSASIKDIEVTHANPTAVDGRAAVDDEDLRTTIRGFLTDVEKVTKTAIDATNGVFGQVDTVNERVSETQMTTYDEYKTTHSIGDKVVKRLTIRIPHMEDKSEADLGYLCSLRAFPSVIVGEEDTKKNNIGKGDFFLAGKDLKEVVNEIVNVTNHTATHSDDSLKALCGIISDKCKKTEAVITKLLDAERSDPHVVKPTLSFIKNSLKGAMQDLTAIENLALIQPKLMMHVIDYINACIAYKDEKV